MRGASYCWRAEVRQARRGRSQSEQVDCNQTMYANVPTGSGHPGKLPIVGPDWYADASGKGTAKWKLINTAIPESSLR